MSEQCRDSSRAVRGGLAEDTEMIPQSPSGISSSDKEGPTGESACSRERVDVDQGDLNVLS
jgi:hypothetical protein